MVSRVSVLLGLLVVVVMPATASGASHLVVAGETLSGIAASNGLSARAAGGGQRAGAGRVRHPGHDRSRSRRRARCERQRDGSPAPFGGYRVRLGDSLSAIAAEHGVSVQQLPRRNGLSAEGTLVAGTSLRLPTGGGDHDGGLHPVGLVRRLASGGGHDVVPGDTLTGIAAANGITPAALAAANGLSANAFVIAGTKLKIPAAAPAASVPRDGGRQRARRRAPRPARPGGLDASQIGSIAAANGAPASLASAIAWQESGFNNAMVSVANARGDHAGHAGHVAVRAERARRRPARPGLPADNVRAGSLLLSRLLRDTGGDTATAVAAYYQGLGSVRRIGMLPETRRYVANVLALRSRFGG